MPEIINDFNKFYNYTPSIIHDTNSMQDFFNSDSNVALFRYEYFKNIDIKEFKRNLLANKSSMFIDEAQKLKNSSTKAHNYIKEIRTSLDYFNLMTATPLMTSLDDMYSLMYLVDPRVLKDYDTFANTYYDRELVPLYPNMLKGKCRKCGKYIYRYHFAEGIKICPLCGDRSRVKCKYDVVAIKNLDKLSSLLKDYMFCYYPVQDINYIHHAVDLYDYNKYSEVAYDTLNDEKTPFSVRMINLQKQTSMDINKVKLLKLTISKIIDEGCVVYCHFKDSVALVQCLLNSMKIESKVISGDVSDNERENVKNWFKSDASNKVLIITSAGGASMNLQVTPHLIFYEIPWGVGNVLQVMGRICRMFSIYKKFFIHFICANHTIDVYKMEMIMAYNNMISMLLNNNYIPSGSIPQYNKHMIASMRRDLCWCK